MPVTYDNPATLPRPIGLYSQVARAGDLVFFAGMAAIDAEGNVIGKGDLEAQMRAVYAEMGVALHAESLSYANVLQITTYLVRELDIEEFYRVRAEVFREIYPTGEYPPSTMIIASRLVDADMLIEIQISAAR